MECTDLDNFSVAELKELAEQIELKKSGGAVLRLGALRYGPRAFIMPALFPLGGQQTCQPTPLFFSSTVSASFSRSSLSSATDIFSRSVHSMFKFSCFFSGVVGEIGANPPDYPKKDCWYAVGLASARRLRRFDGRTALI